MSKSKKNGDSQELQIEQTLSHSERVAKEDAKNRRTATKYGVAILILALAAIAAVVWNSGIVQRNSTAATVGDDSISAAELSYYYNTILQNETYYVYYGMSTFDSTVAADQQMYDETRTYADYFMDEALAEVQSVYALLNAAEADGYVMDEATLASDMATTMESLESYAYSYGLTSVETYLQYMYGSFMTMDIFEKVFEDQTVATAYVTDKTEDFAATDEALESYYAENTDDLDTYTISYMVLLATEPTAEDGTELTDEELSAGLLENKSIQETNANAICAALDAGEDFDTLAELYDVYGAYEHDVYMGADLNSTFADWVTSADRQAGDLGIEAYDGTDRYVYYVVRFESRERDESPTADIRHILIGAGTDPTEEEYDTAYDTAAALLAEWEAGEATAESFGELAITYSEDTSSAYLGGVISGVVAGSGYVETFEDWCIDSSRQSGDTGLVLNEGSSTKGWHIMYFEEWSDPQWKLEAEAVIVANDMSAWHESLLENTPAQLGSGASYVA